MNETPKAVIVEISGGNVRNSHIYLRGAYSPFPNDSLGGSNRDDGGRPIKVQIGHETVETDRDETKAIFRERAAVRRFFEAENIVEGDLPLIERLEPRSFRVTQASKRGFKYYL